MSLSENEIKDFQRHGYLGPVRIFTPRRAHRVGGALLREEQEPPECWYKGKAVRGLAFSRLARNESLVSGVVDLIGRDVLLWGATLLIRGPGVVHSWHSDVESCAPEEGMVSVWLGLRNVSPSSSLAVVPGSHRFGCSIQEAAERQKPGKRSGSPGEVERWAGELGSAEIVVAGCRDGEAIFFDGRLWHGSNNTSRSARVAVLLQYASVRRAVRIPVSGYQSLPFAFHETPRPPCLMIHGSAEPEPNSIVPHPVEPGLETLPVITVRHHAVPENIPVPKEKAFEPHMFFRGISSDLEWLDCHYSVIRPGQTAHPLYRHTEEEWKFVVSGQGEALWKENNKEQRAPLRRGSVVHYRSWVPHSIRSTSEEPLVYLILKYRTFREAAGKLAPSFCLDTPELERLREEAAGKKHYTDILWDGETRWFQHAHLHVSLMQPGGGYPAHADAAHLAIFVLDGHVVVNGEVAGPNHLFFFAPGQMHEVKNTGDQPARYLVMEWYGAQADPSHRRPGRLQRRWVAMKRAVRRRTPKNVLQWVRGLKHG